MWLSHSSGRFGLSARASLNLMGALCPRGWRPSLLPLVLMKGAESSFITTEKHVDDRTESYGCLLAHTVGALWSPRTITRQRTIGAAALIALMAVALRSSSPSLAVTSPETRVYVGRLGQGDLSPQSAGGKAGEC